MTAAVKGGIPLQRPVTVLVFAIVLALVVLPLLVLLRTSLLPAGQLPLESTDVTFANFVTLFTSKNSLTILSNTIIYAGSSTVLALVVATVLAYLTERTDMPGRFLLRTVMFTWMTIPALIVGFGWILLANPGSGVLNLWARQLFGTEGAPFQIYTFPALVITTTIALVPTSFIMISGVLRNMDPQLELAGSVHGARRSTVLRSITMPLLLPGLLSSAIYMLMAVIQTFDLPLVIGMTAKVPVVSTRIYLLTAPDVGVPRYGAAGAFGVVLLALASILVWAYLRLTRVQERFRVVSGKAFRPKRVQLGAWKYPVAAAVWGYCLIMALPLLMMIWASLFPTYRPPSFETLSEASLDVYRTILENNAILRALWNTALMVVATATLTVLLCFFTGWLSVYRNDGVGRVIDALSFIPMTVPPIVMVLGILLIYLKTPLYGTVWIMVVAHVTIFLAFGTRTMATTLMQLNRELANAAMISGASWLTSLRTIVLPLIAPQAINLWLWSFAHAARDLTVPLMLMTLANTVVASTLLNLWQFPNLPGTAALAVMFSGVLLLLIVPAQIYISRKYDQD